MNEKEWAVRLSWDIDGLLRRTEGSEVESVPDFYEKMLELARELSSLDLSSETSRCQATGPRFAGELMRQGPEPRYAQGVQLYALLRRHPVWTVSMSLVSILLLTVVCVPRARTAASEIVKYVQKLVVGKHLDVVKFNEQYLEERRKDFKGHRFSREELLKGPQVVFDEYGWAFYSIGGKGNGSIPGGAKRELSRVRTILEARQSSPYPLRVPAYIPQGHEFREALVSPDRQAYLFYGEPAHEIIVSQGQLESHTKVMVSTDGEILRTTVNGIEAVWLGETCGGGLAWEHDGFVFMVQTADQPMSEAIRIAESLR